MWIHIWLSKNLSCLHIVDPLMINFSSKCYLLFEKVSIFCKFFLASHACIQTAKCTSSASSQSYSTIDIFGEQALSILEKHKESQWCFCCHCSHFRLLRYLLSLSERPPFARYFLCKAQERVILLCTCKVSKWNKQLYQFIHSGCEWYYSEVN